LDLRAAQGQPAFTLYVGLGGTCTNDGGAGLLVGLGAKLLDGAGQVLEPTVAGLAQLAAIAVDDLDHRIFDGPIVVLSDVNSPLCGPAGATQVFGPQKGLTDSSERAQIDRSLARYAALAEAALAPLCSQRRVLDTQLRPGAGAAGGLGFALQLLGATYTSGAGLMTQLLGLSRLLEDSDWLITGEGCSDQQTLAGKAPWMAARQAQAQGVPVTLLSGLIRTEDAAALQQAFQGPCLSLAPGPHCCFSAAEAPPTAEACQSDAVHWMVKAGKVLGQQWASARGPENLLENGLENSLETSPQS
jgi:glycerate 2-kinase